MGAGEGIASIGSGGADVKIGDATADSGDCRLFWVWVFLLGRVSGVRFGVDELTGVEGDGWVSWIVAIGGRESSGLVRGSWGFVDDFVPLVRGKDSFDPLVTVLELARGVVAAIAGRVADDLVLEEVLAT